MANIIRSPLPRDETLRPATRAGRSADARRADWPTVALAIAIYAMWFAATAWHAAIPLPLLVLIGGATLAWHGSLQHETIHGHPTSHRWIDGAIGFAPLTLWLPYAVYHRSHLAHHRSARITDPLDDPESHYSVIAPGWRLVPVRLQATLAGRLLLGPPIRIAGFLLSEVARACRRPRAAALDWIPHLLALLPLLWWLDRVDLPLGTYLLAFVYPGTALTLLRSFAEHRADPDAARRAAIITRPGPFGLLFLNNNLHAVHHARPDLAWYRLPAHLRDDRDRFADAPHYRSYGEIVRRFAWRAHDDVVHPDHCPAGAAGR